jgi:oligosaccharide translocation protein RFT1
VVGNLALAWHLLWVCRRRYDLSQQEDDKDYRLAGILYCVAAVIEGSAEPAVVYFLRRLDVTARASAEAVGVLVKTATVAMGLRWLSTNKNPMHANTTYVVSAFGFAQIVYAITYFVILYANYWNQQFRKPQKTTTAVPEPRWSWASLWHPPTMYMTLIFTIQGIFKFALTEGDRIVMSLLASSYDQGVYAMGSAYGGLAARMILQPFEENARLLFSRLATSGSNTKGSTTKIDPMLEVAYTVLVKIVLYVGLVFSCLAVHYTQILLVLLAGKRWGTNSEAVDVLSAYCVYTAFLAWNGMAEAFVYGVAVQTASEVGALGIAHAITGILFAGIAPPFVRSYGTVGLVAANGITMLFRAIFAVFLAARFFSKVSVAADPSVTTKNVLSRIVRDMLPVPVVWAAFGLAYWGTRVSLIRMTEKSQGVEVGSLPWFGLAFQHVSVGVAFAIGTASVAFALERDFRSKLRLLLKGKRE